jgi:hypothetical protein
VGTCAEDLHIVEREDVATGFEVTDDFDSYYVILLNKDGEPMDSKFDSIPFASYIEAEQAAKQVLA